MARPSAHPGFKALQVEWNRRLAESGFRDIETSGEQLKQNGTERRYERLDDTTRNAKERYFEILAHKVKTTGLKAQMSFLFLPPKRRTRAAFESEQEFYILSLYAQGLSQRDIQRRLKIEGHRCKVYTPLYRWLRLWGLK